MPHSHHSHSGQFCKHAVGTLEDVVRQAISKHFQVFGLTEHVPRYRETDLYPEEQEVSLATLKQQFISFTDEARRLKIHYTSQINLLVGLETEFITPIDLDELSKFLEGHQSVIEYIVGSIHHVNGIPIDFDEPTYRLAVSSVCQGSSEDGLQNFLLAYFDAQYELLQRFRPEIVGHFDLCRLYTPDLKFGEYPTVWDKVERNIKYAISYGALFEVNAAAFRKKWNTAYPGRDIAELILAGGGRFALSDDSHGPCAVGLNYDRTYHYLKSLKVTELWYLEATDEINLSGRKVRSMKLEDWSNHPFWPPILLAQVQ